MKQALVTLWKDYAGRIVSWALAPVFVLAVPVVVAKAQHWFGYTLTPTQARDYMLAGAVLIITPLVIFLLNNAKFDAVVEYLAKRLGVTPATLQAHLDKLPATTVPSLEPGQGADSQPPPAVGLPEPALPPGL